MKVMILLRASNFKYRIIATGSLCGNFKNYPFRILDMTLCILFLFVLCLLMKSDTELILVASFKVTS